MSNNLTYTYRSMMEDMNKITGIVLKYYIIISKEKKNYIKIKY